MKLPQVTNIQKLNVGEKGVEVDTHLTTLESSLQIINIINPEKLVLINGEGTEYSAYHRAILDMRNRSLAVQEGSGSSRKF